MGPAETFCRERTTTGGAEVSAAPRTLVLPIRVWYVSSAESGAPNGGLPFGGNEVDAILEIVRGVNEIYRTAGIYFQLSADGVRELRSEEFFQIRAIETSEIWREHWQVGQPWVNIFYVFVLGTHSGVTYSPREFPGCEGWAVVMATHKVELYLEHNERHEAYPADDAGQSAAGLAHELGHALGLPHTFLTNVNNFGADSFPEPTGADLERLLQYLATCMRPFGDDTADLDRAGEEANPMSYWWKQNPPDPGEMAWTPNQVLKMRLTYFSRVSDTAYQAVPPDGETLFENSGTILLPDLCAVASAAWLA